MASHHRIQRHPAHWRDKPIKNADRARRTATVEQALIVTEHRGPDTRLAPFAQCTRIAVNHIIRRHQRPCRSRCQNVFASAGNPFKKVNSFVRPFSRGAIFFDPCLDLTVVSVVARSQIDASFLLNAV